MISVAAVVVIIVFVWIFSALGGGEPADSQIATPDETAQQTTATVADELQENSSAIQTEATAGSEAETTAPKEESKGVVLDVGVINQHPELPTGCEVTSLTMLLNYYGVYADKCDIADNYLTKGEVGTVDFREAFEGDPRDPDSYGCYAPVIVNAANSYLSSQGSGYSAVEVSGQELEALFQYIDNNTPVIVWGTLDCRQGYPSTVWNVNGRDLQWITPEHCMVLVGYSADSVTVADPFYGEIRTFDIEVFRNGYNTLYKQAVILS